MPHIAGLCNHLLDPNTLYLDVSSHQSLCLGISPMETYLTPSVSQSVSHTHYTRDSPVWEQHRLFACTYTHTHTHSTAQTHPPTPPPPPEENSTKCLHSPPLRPGGQKRGLYSTCASPLVPHPSTSHAHGCLASEIGRDPAFPTRYDRTEGSCGGASPDMSRLQPHGSGA